MCTAVEAARTFLCVCAGVCCGFGFLCVSARFAACSSWLGMAMGALVSRCSVGKMLNVLFERLFFPLN